jgi:hypothetical protein
LNAFWRQRSDFQRPERGCVSRNEISRSVTEFARLPNCNVLRLVCDTAALRKE